MQNNTLITLVVTLIVAGGGGYLLGKGATSGDTTKEKLLQDSITMMNEQAISIQKMGEMMQSNGLLMQEMGMQYKDERMVSAGKDLEVVGANHMKANREASDADDGMGQMMGN